MAKAQISGAIIDAETGDSIAEATLSYKSKKITVKANDNGVYTIARHNGARLTASAVGYKAKTIYISDDVKGRHIDIMLVPDVHQLNEVVVKSKRSKYSRKENPAVTFMRRVIAAKKSNNLKSKDYYSYMHYHKTKLAVNNLSQKTVEKSAQSGKAWLSGQMEYCELNGKNIMPLMVREIVSQELYRKEPHAERTIIKGNKSSGLNELFETGDIATVMTGDVFPTIDIYDDQIRLLRQRFTSPIGRDAIAFYRFYIVDTLMVGRDSCIHLTFLPNNQQDMGFRGELYVVNDSSLHVRKVKLGIPKTSIVNHVNNMEIMQEYQHIGLGEGDWVLMKNDMLVELSIVGEFGNFAVVNTSRYSDYSFAAIPDTEFKRKERETYEKGADYRDEAFWNQHRGEAALTSGEEHTSSFIDGIKRIKGFGWIAWGLKAFIENYIETSPTGKPSYFDIGPVNTMISQNDIDGARFRIGGQTTANLNQHLFAKGYAAYGTQSKKRYYDAMLVYSFVPKKYSYLEYPRHDITIETSYDICNPSDKFVTTDKDNVFTSLRWSDTRKMMFYDRQKFSYILEQRNGFKLEASLKRERNEATGGLLFKPLSEYGEGIYDGQSWEHYMDLDPKSLHNGAFRTAEASLTLEYQPGAKYFNTKQRSITLNREAPKFTLVHTMGLKGFLGGQYHYNVTELKIYKRFFLNSWGILNTYLKGGVQWSQVPYPLLIAPAANISYISAPSADTFNLVNGAEFMNDRYVSLMLSWKLNGKLFNRLPLIKKLKWREYLALKALWGGLSDKNNPTLQQNWNSPVLMAFPEGYNIMNPKVPYVEGAVGIHSILKFFNVDYVYRFNYNNLPSAHRQGIRFSFEFTF